MRDMVAVVDKIVVTLVQELEDSEKAISLTQLRHEYSLVSQGEFDWCIDKLKADGIIEEDFDPALGRFVYLVDQWVEDNWSDIYGDAGVLV